MKIKQFNHIVNTYFQTETAGIISSPTYKESSIKCPHGSVGKTISKYVKLNKLSKNEKKEIKIEKPWPGCMVKIINGPNEWNKYWDKIINFRLLEIPKFNMCSPKKLQKTDLRTLKLSKFAHPLNSRFLETNNISRIWHP